MVVRNTALIATRTSINGRVLIAWVHFVGYKPRLYFAMRGWEERKLGVYGMHLVFHEMLRYQVLSPSGRFYSVLLAFLEIRDTVASQQTSHFASIAGSLHRVKTSSNQGRLKP